MKLCFWVILLCMFTPSDAKSIKVGYIDFPPLLFINNHGKAQGILINILEKTLAHANYQYTFTLYPPKRMFSYLKSGDIDLWVGLANSKKLNEHVLIGSTTVHHFTLQSYSIGKTTKITARQQLNNKTVIIIRGYSYGGWIDYLNDPANNIQLIRTVNHKSALKLLKIGRAKYLLAYKEPMKLALGATKVDNIITHHLEIFSVKFVISKKTNNAKKLLFNLEKSYKELVAQGILK